MKRHSHRNRGVALLLVMVGLVVCMLLTAGFLSTQGTAIGIARNERDAEACRFLAQTGIDMCYAEIRNKSNWRETLLPGKWLNNFSIGNGTVTVNAVSADGSGSFSHDPTQAVILTSTATCNNRSFTLTGTIGPTGGGTVFRGGNFFQGQIVLGNGDLLTAALIDSFNSLIAPYSSASAGSNAAFWTNSNSSGSLTVMFPSQFKGTLVAGPTALLGTVVNLIGALLGGGPSSTSNALESRTPGTVILPNFSGQTQQHYTTTSSTLAPGVYDAMSLASFRTQSLGAGPYEVTGNLTVNSGGALSVNSGANAVVYIHGNLTNAGAITLQSGATLTLIVDGNITMNGSGSVNASLNSVSTAVQILGTSSCANISLNSSSKTWALIYSPGATITMSNSSQLYGAVVANSMTIKNTAAFHFDQAARDARIDNLTGGSAPPGIADYNYSVSINGQ